MRVAIDTSTVVCAGLADGDRVLASESGNHEHVEDLASAIARLLAEVGAIPTDLTEVVIGVGPGPFTGLRVGIATGRTLAWTLGIKPKGVCSLDVLGLQYASQSEVEEYLVASDARRKELYWAHYRNGIRIGEPQVNAPGELPKLPVVGPGAGLYPDQVEVLDAELTLDAGFLAAHADQLPDVGLEPLYLRKPDAELPKTRKSTLTSGRLRLPKLGAR